MAGVETLTTLHKLELYDNHVQKLSGLENLTNLRILDMSVDCFYSSDIYRSFNSIRDMTPVSILPNLEELYLAQNKLRKIAGIRDLQRLRILDLGANRIRV
jgi:protein phosphatase 1 regulatory subunit 7